MPTLVDDNIACLRQGQALMHKLDDTAFAECQPLCFGSSIGEHMRHNIDHFYSFLRGLEDGEVDYDARARDKRLETETAVSIQAVEDIIRELATLKNIDLDRPMKVIMDSGAALPKPAQSSLRRELQFLLSHTVHHYALIGIICCIQGLALPEKFGVAPSTIKHQISA